MAARYQEQYVSEDTLSEISLLEKGVITDMFLRNGIEPKIEHGIPMYPTTAAWQYIQGVEESLPELEELLTYNDVAFFSGVSKKRLGMRMNYQRRKAKDSDSFCRDIEPYLDKGRVKSLPYGLWLVVAPELEGRLIANFIPPADEVFDPLERLTIGQVAEESGLSVEKLQYFIMVARRDESLKNLMITDGMGNTRAKTYSASTWQEIINNAAEDADSFEIGIDESEIAREYEGVVREYEKENESLKEENKSLKEQMSAIEKSLIKLQGTSYAFLRTVNADLQRKVQERKRAAEKSSRNKLSDLPSNLIYSIKCVFDESSGRLSEFDQRDLGALLDANSEMIRVERKDRQQEVQQLGHIVGNGVDKRFRRILRRLGFELVDNEGHYKVYRVGDDSVFVTFACTPSDQKSHKNALAQIIKTFYGLVVKKTKE